MAQCLGLKHRLIILMGLSLLFSPVLAPVFSYAACLDYIPNRKQIEQAEDTSNFIAYVTTLVDDAIIGEIELKRILVSAQNDQIENPILEKESQYKVAWLIHYTRLQALIEDSDLDVSKIKVWVQKLIEQRNRDKAAQEIAVEETAQITFGTKFVFHPIPAGTFMMPNPNNPTKPKAFTLTHTFEMMETPVTQVLWTQIMKDNPSSLQLGPTHPVQNVSLYSAMEFANEYSRQQGLEPVYLFEYVGDGKQQSKEKFLRKAAEGRLTLHDFEYKINAPDENIYKAKGYRLPTIFEQARSMKDNLLEAEYYIPPGNEDIANECMWNVNNSGGSTQPVGLKPPHWINNSPFYDLMGQVYEWHSGKLEFDKFSTGIDPEENVWGQECNLIGGAFDEDTFVLSGFGTNFGKNDQHKNVGLRLVRSLL